jgi:hypothetical protein
MGPSGIQDGGFTSRASLQTYERREGRPPGVVSGTDLAESTYFAHCLRLRNRASERELLMSPT